VSSQRARQTAARLPASGTDRLAIQIAPRTLPCGTFWQAGSVADAGFDEIRELTKAAGHMRSPPIGITGLLPSLTLHARYRESAGLGAKCAELVESIGDPKIMIGMLYGLMYAKLQAGEVVEAPRLAQRVIDLAKAHPRKSKPIVGAPLEPATAGRSATRCFLGVAGWQDEFDNAWTLSPDAPAHRDIAEALRMAQRSAGDPTAIDISRAVLDGYFQAGEMILRGPAATVLRILAAALTHPGFVLHDIRVPRLRPLLARQDGDEDDYRDSRRRCRKG
jgi:hypothetical protein